MRSTLHHEFPLPWTVQERSTCFVVHDKTSQPLAYIHFEDKSGRLSPINQLTRDVFGCCRAHTITYEHALRSNRLFRRC